VAADRGGDRLARADRVAEVELDGAAEPVQVAREEGVVEVVLRAQRVDQLGARRTRAEQDLLGRAGRERQQREDDERDRQQQRGQRDQSSQREDEERACGDAATLGRRARPRGRGAAKLPISGDPRGASRCEAENCALCTNTGDDSALSP
jgi:hypothetical protein